MAEERPVTRSDINDLIALALRLRGRHPDDRKTLVILDRLQPDSEWRHMLDAHEHARLQGIAAKIAENRASTSEREDHAANAAQVAAKVAAHTTATMGGR